MLKNTLEIWKMGSVNVQFVEEASHKSVTVKDTYLQNKVVSSRKFLAVSVAKKFKPKQHLGNHTRLVHSAYKKTRSLYE